MKSLGELVAEQLAAEGEMTGDLLGRIEDALTVAFISGCRCGGKNNPNWRSGHAENCSARYFGKLIEEVQAHRVLLISTLPQAPTDTSKEKGANWCLCNYTGSPGTAPECPVHPSLAARVEPTKKWEVYCECYVKFGKDAKDYVYVVDPVIAKQLVAAHNASCAAKEEDKTD